MDYFRPVDASDIMVYALVGFGLLAGLVAVVLAILSAKRGKYRRDGRRND